jgi:hypothetical protein
MVFNFLTLIYIGKFCEFFASWIFDVLVTDVVIWLFLRIKLVLGVCIFRGNVFSVGSTIV